MGGTLLENTYKFKMNFIVYSYSFDKYSLNSYYMLDAALVSRDAITNTIGASG